MSEPDLTMLALGTDLTGLGLNLNSPDPLYKVGPDTIGFSHDNQQHWGVPRHAFSPA